MNKEERKKHNEAWQEKRWKIEEDKKAIWAMYEKLTYREKLLFTMVLHWMIDNPETTEAQT